MAVIFRGPRTKFLLWFICIHEFESCRSERELSNDFAITLVLLTETSLKAKVQICRQGHSF